MNKVFTTEDGVEIDINSGQIVYEVIKHNLHTSDKDVKLCWGGKGINNGILYFSTPELRDEYIQQNKDRILLQDMSHSIKFEKSFNKLGLSLIKNRGPEDMTISWAFVKNYYPNFENSDEIAEEELLYRLTHDPPLLGEYLYKECLELLEKEYKGDLYDRNLWEDWFNTRLSIYEKAISSFVKSHESNK